VNILALDLGTTTGWALSKRGAPVQGGSESFSPKRSETSAQRWLKFRQFLADIGRDAGGEIHVVYYERVLHHTAVQAAHIYGGFEAMLQVWCEVNRVRMVCVSPMTIKKHWTGKGNVDKKAMMAEAVRRGMKPVDDNHADALALLSLAQAQEVPDEECAF